MKDEGELSAQKSTTHIRFVSKGQELIRDLNREETRPTWDVE